MNSVKKFFQVQSNLSVIVNKGRLYNTYLAIFEILMIIYYNIIPAKTNQASLVSAMNFSSFVAIFYLMYIHVKPSLSNFTTSVQVNILDHIYLLVKTN